MFQYLGFTTISSHRAAMSSAQPDAPRVVDTPALCARERLAVQARRLSSAASRIADRLEAPRRSQFDLSA